MALTCKTVTGNAAGYFIVGGTYSPDSQGRITIPSTADTECLTLWKVENNVIYALVGDPESGVLVTFE